MSLTKRAFTLILLSTLLVTAFSQSTISASKTLSLKLERYSFLTYPQKLYLQTDRDYYYSGDSLWFSAWLTNANTHLPSKLDKILYVEAFDMANQPLSKHLFKLENGRAFGQIELPILEYSTKIKLLAYTNYMRNAGEDFFYVKELLLIPIDSSKNNGNIRSVVRDKEVFPIKRPTQFARKQAKQSEPQVTFMPEGGYMVRDLPSRIAFVATTNTGIPIEVKGKIVDKEGSTVAFFNADKNGKGVFSLTPKEGTSYHAEITNSKENIKKYPLSEPLDNGYTLMVNNRWNSDDFDVVINSGSDVNNYLTLAVTQNGRIEQSYDFQVKSGANLLRINKSDLQTGIIQVTLFDHELTPLLERLVYINNGDYLSFESNIIEENGNQNIKIKVRDKSDNPSQGSFAVSIGPANFADVLPSSNSNIVQYFYMHSLLPGIEADCSYFFKKDNASHQLSDLAMMTNGWRRFKWCDVLADTIPSSEHLLENGFYLSGVISKTSRNNPPVSNVDVTLMGSGSSIFAGSTKTNENGRFSFEIDDFTDTLDVVVQTRDNKAKTKDFNIDIETNLGRVAYDIWHTPPLEETLYEASIETLTADTINYEKYMDVTNQAKVESQRKDVLSQIADSSDIILSEVEITARKRLSPLEKMHSLYGFETYAIGTERIEKMDKEKKWNYGLFSLLSDLFPDMTIMPGRWGNAEGYPYLPPVPPNMMASNERIQSNEIFTFKYAGESQGRFYFYVDGQLSGFTNHKGHLDWAMNELATLDAKLVKSVGIIINPKRSPLPEAISVPKLPNETYCTDLILPHLVNNYPLVFLPATDFIISIQTKKGGGLGKWGRNSGIYKSRLFGFTASREFYIPSAIEVDKEKIFAPTIYWNPDVFVNEEGEISITIEKDHLPKRYLIKVVGMSDEGVPGSELLWNIE